MADTPLVTVAHAIQLSVAPVFLLAGVGMLLAVLNMRLMRIVDRGRMFAERMAPLPEAQRRPYQEEIAVLRRRRRAVYVAIVSGVLAALFVCVLIASVFVGSLVRVDFSQAVAVMFIAAMAAFVSALLFLLREIALALRWPGI